MKNVIIDDEKFLNTRLDKFVLDYFGEQYTRNFIQKLMCKDNK